jgi:hypothetical protein
MSKNLTRKGLALSAVVALGTSLFAGAPAFAGSLVLEPDSGTTYNVLASDDFTIKVYGVDQDIASTAALRWKITKPSGATVVYSDQTGTGITRQSAYTSVLTEDYLVPSAVSATIGRNTLKINPTIGSTDATQTYVVQAYIDRDGTDGLGSGDLASAEKTIKFIKGSEVTPTVVFDQVGSSQKLTGTVTYNSDINHAQTALASTKVDFIEDGTSQGVSDMASRNDAKTALKFTSGNNAAAGKTYGVQVATVRYDGDTTYAKTAVFAQSVATSDATTVTASRASGANATVSGNTVTLRKATASYTYTVTAKKGSPLAGIAAGKPVSITVADTGAALTVGEYVTVNGNKLTGTSGNDSITFNTVTGDKGVVTINITDATGSTASTADLITIAATSNSQTQTTTVTWADAALSSTLVEANEPLGVSTRTIVRGSAVSLKYLLLDQFGQKWTSANTDTAYRVNVATLSGNAGTASATATANFVGGEASVSYTDDSTANTKYSITATVQGRLGDAAWGSTVLSGLTKRSYINPVTALSAATKITLKGAVDSSKAAADTGADVVTTSDNTVSKSANRSDVDLAVIDRRIDTNTQSSLGIGTDKGVKLSGTVTQSNGSLAVGSAVTVAAPGVYFSTSASGDVFVSKDTITVNTDTDGVYTVYAFSQKAGTVTTTVTAGSATAATQKIKFAAVTQTDGYAIAITAPAYTSAGRSVDVTVALTDEFGAPVQSGTTQGVVRVAVSGAGSYTTIATTTDVDGLISFKLIFGANETGTATITATYDKTDDGTREITKSATVTIGSAPATAATAAVSGSTGKFYVSATAAAGKLVVVKVAGKFVTSFKATGSKKSVAVKSSKGSKKVTVFVSGKLAATKTVTVK